MNEISSKIIKDILKSICKNILMNTEKINNNLNLGLNNISEKTQGNEEKYIKALKQQVVFQMVRGKYRQALLIKWISENNTLSKEHRDIELENINKKVQLHIKNGFQSGGKSFGKNELNLLASYKNLNGEELKSKLEKDYKQLNIYNDVINRLINNIEHINTDSLSKVDKQELTRFIDLEVKKVISVVMKSMLEQINSTDKEYESCAIQEKESSTEDNKIEEKKNVLVDELQSIINNLSKDDLINKLQNVFNMLCEKEEVDSQKAYKFGKNSIKEYILSVNCLDSLKEDEKLLINGAMRLTVFGEIGEIKFSQFIKYIFTQEIKITENKYNELIKLIEEKHLNSYNEYLSDDMKIKESKDIDFEEYIYMLKNANPNEKYRKEMDEFNVNQDDKYEEQNEKEKLKENKKPKKKGKFIAIAICVLIGVGGGGIFALKQIKPTNSPDKHSVIPNGELKKETSIIECSENDYILYDSDLRMLEKSELENYTKEELGYIRNEIFARYGYVFKKGSEYKTYFEEKTWYYADSEFKGDEQDLNEYEIANIKLIQSLEKGK